MKKASMIIFLVFIMTLIISVSALAAEGNYYSGSNGSSAEPAANQIVTANNNAGSTGLSQIHIIATAYLDINENSYRDGGEDWLSDFTFELYYGGPESEIQPEDNSWELQATLTSGDSSNVGQADFGMWDHGWYKLIEVLSDDQIAAGWICTIEDATIIWCAAGGGSGETQSDLWFGNYISSENLADTVQEITRLQIRERLQIADEAITQYRNQSQNQLRFYYSDTIGHWAEEPIRQASNWGVVNGYPDNCFGPEDKITGTESLIMMSRMMNAIVGDDLTSNVVEDLDLDIVPIWARVQMQKDPIALRIATQSHNYEYTYGQELQNRVQFSLMLAVALGVDPIDVSEDAAIFLDQETISSDAIGYIYALQKLGIIEGNNGYFNGDRLVSRSEAATMLMRVFNILL